MPLIQKAQVRKRLQKVMANRLKLMWLEYIRIISLPVRPHCAQIRTAVMIASPASGPMRRRHGQLGHRIMTLEIEFPWRKNSWSYPCPFSDKDSSGDNISSNGEEALAWDRWVMDSIHACVVAKDVGQNQMPENEINIWFWLMIFDFLLFLERMWWTSRTTRGSWRFVWHVYCGPFFHEWWWWRTNAITYITYRLNDSCRS